VADWLAVLTLRRPTPADADALVAACQDPEVPRWTNVPSPYTHDDALAYIHSQDPTRINFLGFEDDVLVGSFSLLEIDLDAEYGEVGYWVVKEARGRGIATQAVERLKLVADQLGLTRLELIAHSGNVGSRGVAVKAGFVDTGELRPAPRVVPPTAPDYVVYAWSAE
jgi:RimJ/RimL family protein N-acetyltransferase